MTTLTLIRGLPGSGKTTLAGKLMTAHFEADMYFYNQDGDYEFDVNLLRYAHIWCQDRTQSYLEEGIDVVVSNTFTTLKEMRPYYEMAKELGVKFNVITCHGQFGNIHNVPEETLAKMKARFFHGDVLEALENK